MLLLLTLGNVYDERDVKNIRAFHEIAQADFSIELTAVLPLCAQFFSGTFWPDLRCCKEIDSLHNVSPSKVLGYQHFDLLARQLSRLVSEHLFGGWINPDDLTFGIRKDDPFGCVLKQRLQLALLNIFILGHAAVTLHKNDTDPDGDNGKQPVDGDSHISTIVNHEETHDDQNSGKNSHPGKIRVPG